MENVKLRLEIDFYCCFASSLVFDKKYGLSCLINDSTTTIDGDNDGAYRVEGEVSNMNTRLQESVSIMRQIGNSSAPEECKVSYKVILSTFLLTEEQMQWSMPRM